MGGERENTKFVGVMGFFHFNLLTISYMVTGATFRKPSIQNLFLKVWTQVLQSIDRIIQTC